MTRMTTVAVWQPADVENGAHGAALTREALHSLTRAVSEGHIDDQIADAAIWSAQVRAISRVRKESHELNVQACRLEAAIARRCVVLGRDDLIEKPSWIGSARSMATLSDAEFDAYLVWIDRDGSVGSLWAAYRAEQRRKERIEDLASGRVPDRSPDLRVRPSDTDLWDAYKHRQYEGPAFAPHLDRGLADSDYDARDAAADLLDALTRHGVTFTTEEAADRLGQALEVDADDDVVRTGLHALVREAVGVENRTNDRVRVRGRDLRLPAFVTFRTADGWQRVPWAAAGLDQLGLMAAHRRTQADEMRQAAVYLEFLYEALSAASTGGDDYRCADLLGRAIEDDLPQLELLLDDPEPALTPLSRAHRRSA